MSSYPSISKESLKVEVDILHVIYYAQLGIDEDVKIIHKTRDELKLLLHLRLGSLLCRTFVILWSLGGLYGICCWSRLTCTCGVLAPGQVDWRGVMVHSSLGTIGTILETVFDVKLHMAWRRSG